MRIFIEPECSTFYREHPLVLIDAGAARGLNKNWFSASKYLRVIGFEPDSRSYDTLMTNKSPNSEYFNVGLSKEKGAVRFYLTRKPTGSSLFKPNEDFIKSFPNPERFDIIGDILVEVDTLDNLCKQHNIQDVDFIKLDTQGSELLILKGAQRLLDSTVFGVEIEVEFAELYKGQPLFSEIDGFLRSLGFYLFDLKLTHWKRSVGIGVGWPKGQLICGDALYLRSVEHMPKILSGEDEQFKKSKIVRAISICLLYGYCDYALYLVKNGGNVFTNGEIEMVEKTIRKQTPLSNRIPNFRGRARLAEWLSVLSDVVRPTKDRWNVGLKTLGNV